MIRPIKDNPSKYPPRDRLKRSSRRAKKKDKDEIVYTFSF